MVAVWLANLRVKCKPTSKLSRDFDAVCEHFNSFAGKCHSQVGSDVAGVGQLPFIVPMWPLQSNNARRPDRKRSASSTQLASAGYFIDRVIGGQRVICWFVADLWEKRPLAGRGGFCDTPGLESANFTPITIPFLSGTACGGGSTDATATKNRYSRGCPERCRQELECSRIFPRKHSESTAAKVN
jgi:hypothetical protein